MKLLVIFLCFYQCCTSTSVVSALTSIGSSGRSEVWCESTKPTRLVNILYEMCLNEVPIHVDATVKSSDSSLPHQFNLTVKRVEKYSFLVEILRTDLDSGWGNILLTVQWTAYMKKDNCYQLYSFGYRRNGLYNIYLDGSTKLEVYCDLENHGGGWTVIQRNMDNRTDFDRNWLDYKTGFGNKLASFWIGLENIRALTKNGDNELRIDITTCDNTKIVAEYSNFTVGPESDRYRLQMSGYQHKQGTCVQHDAMIAWPCFPHSNLSREKCENHNEKCCYNANATGDHRCTHTAGIVGFFTLINCTSDTDSMAWVNGKRFSTKDISPGFCPSTRKGGWWYDHCSHSSLNGLYDPCKIGVQYAYWKNWSPSGRREGVRFTEMKIRPAL
ncbi:ficolin-1-like [Ciona intestinalis]